ncbi:MAG: beta-ketoacyl synthase N-terminal-like domain-containing protein, partial [Candidatus Sumerlaeota bacterium]|nr:beta-ketoacyl synthase N-terminal-like domain-containing protein [Candidatus Sumerlaeota bacterium]
MEEKRVVVTGLGAVTPIGNDVRTYWESLIAGKSGVAQITCFDASSFDCRIAAEVKNFNPEDHFDKKEVRRVERFCQFAVVSSRQAIADSGIKLDQVDRDKFGVIIGVGIGAISLIEEQTIVLFQKGPGRVTPLLIPKMIPNMAAGMVAIDMGLKGPNSCTVTACASGTNAIGDAF